MESRRDYPLGKVCEGQPNIHENMKCSGKSNVYNQKKRFTKHTLFYHVNYKDHLLGVWTQKALHKGNK